MDLFQSLRLKNLFGNLADDQPYQPGINEDMLPTTIGQPAGPAPNTAEGMANFPIQLGDPPSTPLVNMSNLSNPQPQSEPTMMDHFSELLSQYPKREDYHPSLLRQIGGTLVGAFKGADEGAAAINAPFEHKLTDWKNKLNPEFQASTLKHQTNVLENTARHQTETEKATKEAQDLKDKTQAEAQTLKDRIQVAKEDKDANDLKIKQKEVDLKEFKIKHPDLEFQKINDGSIYVFNPATGEHQKIAEPHELSQTAELELTHKFKMAEIDETGKNKLASQNNKGWSPVIVPDGKGGYKSILLNQDTGQMKDLIDTELYKPANMPTKADEVTNQTKTMMEGAKMLLPHISDLRKQAADLDKRGLFGPVMSRIRELAAKVGTTGSPEEVENSLNTFSDIITKDPKLNNDAAVGQFITNLGLMTSGMGRVHGGARGGGSIEMIKYLKSLLSSESTLSMFNGRLNTVDSYLKGYASGPKGNTNNNSKIDAALDKIFGTVK